MFYTLARRRTCTPYIGPLLICVEAESMAEVQRRTAWFGITLGERFCNCGNCIPWRADAWEEFHPEPRYAHRTLDSWAAHYLILYRNGNLSDSTAVPINRA